ncbi:carbohydrate ABC transporter permease [Streptomyces albidoflavus]|uniref:carbohydrate ABC transporter permease n=1 Tax=Streptomyces TaxID=1883 RepID=UPI001161EF56|nr:MULTISPECIES: carbohydrate ABC transporter permease [unclassified Streptomyces]MBL0778151.1 carbohydrate ABC transporter permease [Streptomyces albidoflavus]MBL0800597.1 carbohydrate ABC transporter permease [Streptomyces albidoflavus]MCG5118946.1 carbohydrate ABC transporter permease [Streptomyces sp. T7(2022)]MDH6191015.1 multiple sugar transport system permease protein [Streptomyces sp. CZ24]QDD60439.1 carbohydrate ABC transporter permease [Streptomyces albidoflavus]
MSAEGRVRRPLTYVLLSGGLLVMAAPFLWMALSAFKTQRELSASPPVWIPGQWTLANFRQLLADLDLPLYFMNSVIVAVLVTVSNLVFCSMLGYALAKLRFAGRSKVFGVVLGALMVPGNLMLLPLFVLMSKLQLIDSYAGLVLPFAAGAFGVFLMRQFMQSIPGELLEAARMDGAGEWFIFWRIVMPLVKPALATLAILTFLGSWNNFVWPLIATNDPDKYTLPVALATFATDPNKAGGSNGVLMAGSFLIVLPVLAVFIALQRHFTQGIATAGMK